MLFHQDLRHLSWLPALACISSITTQSPFNSTRSPAIRMNEIQIVATHNSYHIENNSTEKEYFQHIIWHPEGYYYSHRPVHEQLDRQQVRGFEFDVWADSQGGRYAEPIIRKLAHGEIPTSPLMYQPGAKVFHVSDLDVRSTCYTLVSCLLQVKAWSDAHPTHVPIPIQIEFKVADKDSIAIGGVQSEAWNSTNLDFLDEEIRSVFPEERIITPDSIRKEGLTLEQSVLQHGWPTLDESRGKVYFTMDNNPDRKTNNIRIPYRSHGRKNLEGRVIFTNSFPGQPDCAFIKRNIATGRHTREVQQLVKAGYIVRARADIPIMTVTRGDTKMRDAAFLSGAQIVSTDFPEIGMSERYDSDYVCKLPGKKVARCNPVNAPCECQDSGLE